MVARNTLPVTAADVVGGQVTFTAVVNGTNLVYQWQKILGGVTNNIAGCHKHDVDADQSATDQYGFPTNCRRPMSTARRASAPSSLTVSSVPAAVNNVITAYAAQTGLGSVATNFVPT